MTVGTDLLLTGSNVVGGFLDFLSSDRNFMDGSDEEVDENGVSVFTILLREKFDLALAARFGSQDRTSTRVTSVNDIAIGEADADVFGISGGANFYLLSPPGGLGVTLTTFVDYVEFEVDSFTETGQSPATLLRYDAATTESLVTSLGIEVSKPVSASWGVIVPKASLEWSHQFEDDTPQARAVSLADPSIVSFSQGAAPDQDWARAELGAIFVGERDWSGFFTVDWDIGRDDVDRTTFTLGLRKEFGAE